MNYGRNNIKDKQKDLSTKKVMKQKRIGVRLFKVVLLLILVSIVAVSLGIFMLVKNILDNTPEVTPEDLSPVGYTSFIVDQDGKQIEKLVEAGSNRVFKSIDQIPDDLEDAFIAIEDSRFREHIGVDPIGILRALVSAFQAGALDEGGSTITQQLIKNSVFTNFTEEKNDYDRIERKLQEILLAIDLEKEMSKDMILENYLNTINLGQNTLGVQAAATRYFNKDVADLTLSECAVIAGITKNPSGYNPISNPDRNQPRRRKVLDDMLTQGLITQEEYDIAMADTEAVYTRIQEVNKTVMDETSPYSYYTDEIINQVLVDLQERLGYTLEQAKNKLYSGGITIHSYQDSAIQQIADEEMANEANYPDKVDYQIDFALTIIREDGTEENHSVEMLTRWISENYKRDNSNTFSSPEEARELVDAYRKTLGIKEGEKVIERFDTTPQPQASCVIMDQHTGIVKALVGGRGTKESSLSLNRATDTMRQPGSTFKIVSTYAPALDLAEITLGTTVDDHPFKYANGQVVRNSNGRYAGDVSIRYAIKKSINTVAVQVLTDIGPSTGYEYIKNFGFTTVNKNERDNQSMALGGLTNGVTNLELTASYAAIANDGTYVKPRFYSKITDHSGEVIIDNQPESRRVLKDTTAALVTNALRDVVTSGTGTRANIGRQPVVGKTGTTNDYKDIWFVGYSPYYTAGIWGGYDKPQQMSSYTAGWRTSLWSSIMKRVHAELEPKQFVIPDSVKRATVCRITGKIAMSNLPVPLTAVQDYGEIMANIVASGAVYPDGAENLTITATCPTVTELFAPGTYFNENCDCLQHGHAYNIPSAPVIPDPEPPATEDPDGTTDPVPPTTDPVPPTTDPVPPTTDPEPPTPDPVPPQDPNATP